MVSPASDAFSFKVLSVFQSFFHLAQESHGILSIQFIGGFIPGIEIMDPQTARVHHLLQETKALRTKCNDTKGWNEVVFKEECQVGRSSELGLMIGCWYIFCQSGSRVSARNYLPTVFAFWCNKRFTHGSQLMCSQDAVPFRQPPCFSVVCSHFFQ